jgi:hypothetical protein
MVDKKNLLKISKIALDIIMNDDNAQNDIVKFRIFVVMYLANG